jgi:imidazolonepropionase-like amidohydrolase
MQWRSVALTLLRHVITVSAKVIDMVGKLGCVKSGAFADLLLLGSNPLEDIGIMNKPHQYLKAVVKDGRCVKSSVKGLSVEISLD